MALVLIFIMHISWLGGSTIRLQTKPNNDDVVVVIDPYKPPKGEFPRSLTPSIALFTRGEKDSITLSGEPFILAIPGECETKGVLISALYRLDTGHLIFRLDAEGLSVAHLGFSDKQLTDKELELVADADILFLPIGAVGAYSPEDAVKVINAIEPRVVIPMAFKSDNDPTAAGPEAFLREMGAKAEAGETKVIIRKKDLPQDETKVVILKKE